MDSSKIISLEDFTKQKNQYPSEEEALTAAIELCKLVESSNGNYPLLNSRNIYIENENRWVTAHPPVTGDSTEALFRVGAVLYHFLTRSPFQISHFLDGPRPVRERNPQISVRLEGIVSRLLQTVRSQRYSNVSELRQDLERLQKELQGDLQIHWSCFKGNGLRTNFVSDPEFNSTGETLKELWRAPLGEIWASPVLAGDNVFVGSGDGNFYSIDSVTGKSIWKIATGGRIEGTACIHKNIAYIGNDVGAFFAINLKNGSIVWKKSLGEYVRSSAFCDGKNVYVGSINPARKSGLLWALNSETGNVSWKKIMGPVFSSPCVDHDDVIVGSDDEILYCFSKSGIEKWRTTLTGKIRSTAALGRDSLYVGAFGGTFYKIKRQSGEIVWENPTAGSMYSSPALAKGVIVCGNNSGAILSFHLNGGKTKGQFATGGPVTSSPLIVNQFILSGSNDGHFYLLDAQSQVVATFQAHSPINSSATYYKNRIYVGSDKGLHALSL